MKYNRRAKLDTSEVRDTRRSGGGGRGGAGAGGGLLGSVLGGVLGGRRGAAGGGGLAVVALVIYLVVTYVGGSSSSASGVLSDLGRNGNPSTADNRDIQQECRTGEDANDHLECAVVADINSIQDYWSTELPTLGQQYVDVPTIWFSGQVSTGCGSADSGAGPFYCPADKRVYIDLSFYNDLTDKFGAEGGLFVDAYVLAHEYGHHVQDLLGTEARVRTRTGASSDSVRLELQADCYAGVWAKHATEPDASGAAPLISEITADDISRALDAASRIGDDYIQRTLGGGQVDTSRFTHGSSAQRKKWLSTGYRTGEPQRCNTFTTSDLG